MNEEMTPKGKTKYEIMTQGNNVKTTHDLYTTCIRCDLVC